MRLIRLLLLLTAMCLAPSAAGQTVIERLVSPGPLAAAHAQYESRCNACHASFDKTAQTGLCADCHRPIRADIAARSGFHGKSRDAATRACKTCHTDHAGRGAAIVRFDPRTFDHAASDYPLAGAHVRVQCASCHVRGKKFREAPAACVGCHLSDDPHRRQLGDRCESCHVDAAWNQIRFDHSGTGYPLRGAHARVGCKSCHAAERYKNTPRACIDCHRSDDAHNGTLGTRCESCHAETAWRTVRFDHGATRFPLVGAHNRATCASCHIGGRYRGIPTTCINCHRADDAHQGRLGADCAACHTPANWKTTRFDHARTGFALQGRHATTTCQSCHREPADRVHLNKACVACHADDDKHAGRNGPTCEQCHNAADWKRTSFDHAAATRFPLRGAHAPLACERCHVRPAREVKLNMACASCHTSDDQHAGQLGANCGQCHNDQAWNSSVRFDHDLTPFPLIGAHKPLQCVACHASKRFKDAPIECVRCHEDDNKHAGRLGPNCAQCHDATAWVHWNFNHDTQTRYPLTGAHRGLDCEACHSQRNVRRIRQSGACMDCHAADDAHHGEFGVECGRCHTTETFRGARRR